MRADPEIFFPLGQELDGAAKQYCARCRVRGSCLDYALAAGEEFGVWGGMTTDTQALNDIHALLTGPTPTAPARALQDVASILARTGRLLFPSRIITATVKDDPHGLPVALVDAEGTTVTVHQAPNGPGIQVDVIPRDNADERALVVCVSGQVIWHARPQPIAPRSDS